ncbi:MAG: TIGR02302 family protein [Rhodospirillales bacterium]|nr:TIGR02302 family protein [Rhodospirillales bacterium]
MIRKPPRTKPLPIAKTRLVLLCERVWQCWWPPVLLGGAFLALAFGDVLPRIPGWLHVIVLAAFAAALAYLARASANAFRPPRLTDAHRRLEEDNGLSHRPLAALDDRLASGTDDAGSLLLWHAHLRRMAASVRGLRVKAPAPRIARLDSRALRTAVLVVLVIALVAARADPLERLARAFAPRLASAAGHVITVDAWITPPAYTGAAPIFIDQRAQADAAAIPIPVGSMLVAHVYGAPAANERDAPQLGIGETKTPFAPLGAGPDPKAASYRVEAAIETGERIVITRRADELAAWPIEVIADQAPTISYTTKPHATPRSHLRFAYVAADDYGLLSLTLDVRRSDGRSVAGADAMFRLGLPYVGASRQSTKGQQIRDLTAHPWAGLPVQIRLEAVDAIGQRGFSEDSSLILPERVFNHPVARAIVEQRKKLSLPSPTVRARVATALQAIAGQPMWFAHDSVVFLVLSVARSRLLEDERDEALSSVQKLLWDTALRLEDGELSISEREMLRIQEDLMRALRDGGEFPEIDRLMDELRRMIDEYMEALAERLLRDGMGEVEIPPNAEMLGRDDMQRMIEQARDLARMGNREAANRLLEELQRMLDNLRTAMQQGTMRSGFAETQELMDQLRDLAKRQQSLLDQTFRRSNREEGEGQAGARPDGPQGRPQPGEGRPGQQGQMGSNPGVGEAAEQEAIRRALGELMLKLDEMLGSIPDNMGLAERAMREAERALNAGRPGDAVAAETEALVQLRSGMEAAMEELTRGAGAMLGLGGTRQMPLGQFNRFPRRDPFGRNPDGAYGSAVEGFVEVPDAMEMRRAREILLELRRRASQRDRPRIERDYIERLLRQF